MAKGPGKYNDMVNYVRKETRADCVVLIVINGTRGSGFSIQAAHDVSIAIPELLEMMAKDIRKDVEGNA